MFLLVGAALVLGGFTLFSGKLNEGSTMKVESGDIPNKYDYLFIKHGNAHGVDYKLLKRIAWIESTLGLNPRVKKGLINPKDVAGSTSTDGKSWGLMQFTIPTARDFRPNTTEIDLNNPEISIELGSQYFAFLKRSYPQFSERDLVMSYNHGQGNQLKFIAAEKSGTLSSSSYLAGRQYYQKYLKAKELVK